MKRFFAVVSFFCLAFASPLYAADNAAGTPEKSLYERLGGQAGISAVVDDFVPRTAANPAVNFMRQGQPRTWEATPENIAILKKHLVQFVSVATGSTDVPYEGRDMVAAHQGLSITNAEFDALAADLAASCDKLGVPTKEKEELLAIAGSTRGSIVQAGQ